MSKRIEGDQEVAENGARQTNIDYQMELIDPHAILMLGHVLKVGADKYGVDNWRGIPRKEHVGRAIHHLYQYLASDPSENHLANAFTRVMMAMAADRSEWEERLMKEVGNARGAVRPQAG